jgi:hypothetical protein
MKKIVVDGVEYLPRSESSSRKIVVLDRGFVVVGLVSFDGEYVVTARRRDNVRELGVSGCRHRKT